MSRVCALTGTKKIRRNKISITRSKISRRTKGFALPNLVKRKFKSSDLGTLKLKINIRTLRTIDKYGSLENFLLFSKRKRLTTKALNLRRKLKSKEAREMAKAVA